MSSQHDTPSGERATGTEIERKFLVRELPELTDVKQEKIVQGYLAVDSDGTEVRLRHKGDKYFLTVKTGAGEMRGEIEQEIPAALFDVYWPATEGKRLEKTRYFLDYQNHVIELDLYEGRLEGLQVAEVEFDSEAESAAFAPPGWFGREITIEQAYKNQSLALHGRPGTR